jgi:hypothetical protein
MEYVVRILDIIIWPSVIITALFALRSDLGSILRRLVKIETSHAKMMFNEELKKAEEDLADIPSTTSSDQSDWFKEMTSIAKLNPRAAIIESWTAIELACIELGILQGTKIPRFSPGILEKFLHNIPEFEPEMINKVMDLRRLRNTAAHGKDIDLEFVDAEKYIELADKTLSVLASNTFESNLSSE